MVTDGELSQAYRVPPALQTKELMTALDCTDDADLDIVNFFKVVFSIFKHINVQIMLKDIEREYNESDPDFSSRAQRWFELQSALHTSRVWTTGDALTCPRRKRIKYWLPVAKYGAFKQVYSIDLDKLS